MEIKLPSTGSHRLDWLLMLLIVIVLLVIFI
jgi:LPXTG-motif cell wall-anchored protein